MRRFHLPLVLFFPLVAPLAAAALDCDLWNTKEYFETATIQDVKACLAGGVDVAASTEDGHTPCIWRPSTMRIRPLSRSY